LIALGLVHVGIWRLIQYFHRATPASDAAKTA
jgi:hypothetical protein